MKIQKTVLCFVSATLATTVFAGGYSIDKDYGSAASWEWFKRKIVIKCDGGRKSGEFQYVYLESSGKWSTTEAGSKFDTFQAAASAACN